jgi:hypothetical protein
MKVSDALHAMHKNAEAYHIHKAEHHRSMAENHEKLAEFHKGMDGGKDASKVHKAMAAAHEATADNHDQQSEFHAAQMAECEKALSAADLAKSGDRIIPDQVRGVITSFPMMVPRAGAPQNPQAPNVPVEFADLVKVSDDDE